MAWRQGSVFSLQMDFYSSRSFQPCSHAQIPIPISQVLHFNYWEFFFSSYPLQFIHPRIVIKLPLAFLFLEQYFQVWIYSWREVFQMVSLEKFGLKDSTAHPSPRPNKHTFSFSLSLSFFFSLSPSLFHFKRDFGKYYDKSVPLILHYHASHLSQYTSHYFFRA